MYVSENENRVIILVSVNFKYFISLSPAKAQQTPRTVSVQTLQGYRSGAVAKRHIANT